MNFFHALGMDVLIVNNTEVYTVIGAGIFAIAMIMLILFTRRGT